MINLSSGSNVRGGDRMLFLMAMAVLVTTVLSFIMIAETSED